MSYCTSHNCWCQECSARDQRVRDIGKHQSEIAALNAEHARYIDNSIGVQSKLQSQVDQLQTKLTRLIEAAEQHLEWGGVRNMCGQKNPLCPEAHAASDKLRAAIAEAKK